MSIKARMLLDSRGNPAVEAEVQTQKATASAIMPEGASTGSLEAMELRDGGKAFLGKGVKKAIANVNETIAPKLKGLDSGNQKQADKIMLDLDSTSNKSRLGANAILPVSIALCKASAAAQGIPEAPGAARFAHPLAPGRADYVAGTKITLLLLCLKLL